MVDGTPQGQGTGAEGDNQSPQLPEGIASVEELVQKYQALAKPEGQQQGSQQQEQDSKKEEEDILTKGEKVITEKGLDISKYGTEIIQSGTLSDESFKELEAKGFSKQDVTDYVEAKKVQADKKRDELLSDVGGIEGYKKVLEWGKTALNEQEREKFNSILGTANEAAIKLAINDLSNRMVKETGRDPKLFRGDTTQTDDTFQTLDDAVSAIRDPKYYDKSPEGRKYAKAVQEKIKASTHLYKHKV